MIFSVMFFSKTIIISDIDDTIKNANSAGKFPAVMYHFLKKVTYFEMRDFVADPMFLLRKKIEAKFSAMYPDKWMPLYSQVTFSSIRYSVALKQGEVQKGIMDQIMEQSDIVQKWDSPEVMDQILSLCV